MDQKTILLVEDEALIAMAEQQMLERHGYRVVLATTGQQAVEIAAEQAEIDLVLMDIDLGRGIDGTEAAALILEIRDLPIAFLSSHTEPEIVERTERITSYGYIVKNSGETVLTTSLKMAFRLFDSRKLAADTFDHSINGLCVHRLLYDEAGDPCDCEYLKVNEAFGLQTGLAGQDLIGKTIRDLYPKGEAREILALYVDVVKSRVPIRREVWFEPTASWYELSVFPTQDDEFTVVVANITERKLALEGLALEKERLRVTLRSVGDAVVTTDETGRVTFLNPVAERLMGLSAESAAGRPLPDVFRIVNAFSRQRTENPVDRVLTEGITVGLANHTVLLSRNGNEYQIADSAAPIFDTGERIIGVVLVFRDVTEEYAVQQELRESERDLQRAQQLANIGSWRFHLSSGTVTASPQAHRIYGLENGELTIPRAQAIPLEKYRGKLDAALRDLIDHGIPYDVEFEIRRPSDGEIRFIHSVAEYDADGHTVVGTLHDITERKRGEEQIHTLLREKEVLLRESHHRITNNMNTLHGLLSLQSHAADSPRARDVLTDAANRLQAMIRLYDRLFRNTLTGSMSIREFLTPLLDEIVEILSPLVPVRVSADVEDILIDAKTLTTIGIAINELITNSVKHAFAGRDNGHVSVAVATGDSHITLTYQDDGPGLNANTDTRETTGFGMQLVEMMVQNLEGEMRVQPGDGLRIELVLPDP